VWGLGATIYTAITGRYVHDDAQSLHEQLIASATRRSRPIRHIAPHVSPAVSLVIDRALELEMSDRWPSARDMQAALRAARGPQREAFTADSMTMPVASISRPRPPPPATVEQATSSGETRQLPNAVPARAYPALGAHASSDDPDSPFGATQLSPTAAAPAPRVRGSAPPPPPPPAATERMRGPFHSRPEAFRGPMLTPSEEHVTIPTAVSPRAFPAPAPQRPAPAPRPESLQPGQGQTARPPLPTGHEGVLSSDGQLAPAAVAQGSARKSSARAILFVSLFLLAVCAAMGAYVLSRGSAPHAE